MPADAQHADGMSVFTGKRTDWQPLSEFYRCVIKKKISFPSKKEKNHSKEQPTTIFFPKKSRREQQSVRVGQGQYYQRDTSLIYTHQRMTLKKTFKTTRNARVHIHIHIVENGTTNRLTD